ncbi:MAG: AarF/UbiB family protein [Myxococcota bacterium]|nr:AarF/UbiB family protein [Myxococcota bacterium]
MAKKSRWRRIAKLGELSTKVSSSYLGQRVTGMFQGKDDRELSLRSTHLKNAERIVDTMSVLKGAAMKVGQSLAVMADSMDLPDEVSSILSKLNDQAQPVPFEEIEAVIRSQIDGEVDDIFAYIDPEPLGTASLAQAHAAQLKDGQWVVIKVLHDGVEYSVDTDLKALKSILLAGRFLQRSKEEIDLIFDEIRERLLEELDYRQEAKNLEEFHQFFQSIDGVQSPKPILSLCSDRILVMERLVGAPLETFYQNATPQAKQRAGDLLTAAFHEMLYVFRALHADPHGGNFLFKEDGSLALIDFGCVKRFSLDFLVDYGRLGNAIIDHEREETLRRACDMEMILNPNSALEDDFWDFLQIIAKPFRVGEYFVDGDTLMAEIRESSNQILKHKGIRAPRDIIFLHRSLMGTYSMLRKLGHRCNYEDIRRHYVLQAIDIQDGVVEDRGWDARG